MDTLPILFGIETEYGIARDGADELDVVQESIDLVRSATIAGVRQRWDYSAEDPHLDMRGFRVMELRQDYDEANYTRQDEERELSFEEIKSDLVLPNGARFYNDHAHPEYCTPECRSFSDIVMQDRAGERILEACAQTLSKRRGTKVRVYKNNTDFWGHSYGCHENYLLPRSLAWATLAEGMEAFLVTRQIFAGAGKFGIEAEDSFEAPGFQIAQRSDFFSELQSVDTMQRRPIINTRDEPHANARLYRRFHVIIGDANMSPFATRLKVGVTALVLEALVLDPKRAHPRLKEPLVALPAISQDASYRWEVALMNRQQSTALEIQRHYLACVKEVCDLGSPERVELVADWERVLNDLEKDYRLCRDRLDWVTKLMLVKEFQAAENVADDDPWLRSLDLAYHLVDEAEGLHAGLEHAGVMRGVPEEKAVMDAVNQPPKDTRAWIRGRCVAKFAEAIISAQWDHVTLRGSQGRLRISLLDLFAPEDILRYAQCIERAVTPDDLQAIAET